MPLPVGFTKAQKSNLKVSKPITDYETFTELPDVDITIGATGAVAGDTTLEVEALPVDIKKNTILYFDESGVLVPVLVTVDAAESDTELTVDSLTGKVGDGIPVALSTGTVASYDQLYRVMGTEQADYTSSEGVTTYSSNTYDSFATVTYNKQTIDTAGWTISRNGRQALNDFGFQQCQEAALGHKVLWVKLERPNENGDVAMVYEGKAWLTGWADTGAATGLNDANWTFQGEGDLYWERIPVV